MQQLLDEPAVVLIALTFASLLFLAEVALPTLGIAGTLGLAFGGLGAWAVAEQDADWRPLLLSKFGVAMWCVLVAMRKRSRPVELAALVCYGAGMLLFAAVEEDWLAAGIGIGLTLVVAAGYPRLQEAAIRLLDGPPKVGKDWLVGQRATVEAWSGTTGTVRVQGALWNATAAGPLSPGTAVEVLGFQGMTASVAPLNQTQHIGG